MGRTWFGMERLIVNATGTISLKSYDVHEFFNQCHSRADGKFCGGSSGGAGGSGGASTNNQTAPKEPVDPKENRFDTLKNIAVGLAAISVSVGLAYAVHTKTPGSVKFSKAARHSAHLEGLLKKGGADLDNAILDRKAKIVAGKNVDRNVRDLEVLENKGFLHQDDAAQFLNDLKKVDYTQEERDALWEYGGLHLEEEDGIKYLAKGPVTRYNAKIRRSHHLEKLTKEEIKTLKLVNQAIRKNRLPRDVTLHRTSFLSTENVRQLAKAKPGAIFRDNAPIYTGLTEARAMPYTAKNRWPKTQQPVHFIIRAKKGLPAIHSPYGESVKGRAIPIPLETTLPSQLNPKGRIKRVVHLRIPLIEYLNKEEIVLQRNQGLRIISSHKRADGVLVVEVEALASI